MTWNSCFSAVRWRWILAHFVSILPLYLCCQLQSSEGQRTTSSPEGERKSIRLSNPSPRWRIVLYKSMQSSKFLLLLLFCKGLGRNGRCSFRWNHFFKMTLWQRGCCSDTADLTLSRKSFSEPGFSSDVEVLACHQQPETPPRSPQLLPREHMRNRGERMKKMRGMLFFLALKGHWGQLCLKQLKHNPLFSCTHVTFSRTAFSRARVFK